ncbi:hypothetical protein [Paraburkholderia acidiphila]|uniref:Uncharacterized protein n=1 Tax=Paraburkholderia acidiphila TaxID=2571747 RepID=A0A7Z2G8I1_9BURK|nr:hypothetical protein [Paraburkholderia acidiphila]QGZ56734.1 hypothetical protein FAZ97_17370 [Paraburkholderia acidiphila]
MATSNKFPAARADREDNDEVCVKRASLMSMLAELSDDATRIEDRLGQLAGVLAPLVEDGLDFCKDDDSDDKEGRALPSALSKVDRVRDRLARIDQFIGEIICRAQM